MMEILVLYVTVLAAHQRRGLHHFTDPDSLSRRFNRRKNPQLFASSPHCDNAPWCYCRGFKRLEEATAVVHIYSSDQKFHSGL